MTQHLRMRAAHSVLVLVDYQERLMPAMTGGAEAVRRAAFLAQVASQLDIPAVLTAQNPGRLGPNDGAISAHLADPGLVVEKMAFGACEGGLDDTLARYWDGPNTDRAIVVAGCEAHVCLLQTALGLLEAGRQVFVVADASASRHVHDKELAMARLRQAGAIVVSAEMVAFEWLGTAEHPQFKAVSKLVKEL
ncbi:nicotinamidase-related amidase [Kineosphaera limosa]|uniref:Putative hydrolase n=1 Tax=Kineosphaera limosa NBRC 100340 TaxID=1184609 RepID=K6WRT7_9MICO|nr:isochorismatase family protein [Kineosphaera limosa]NYD99088.1 nicotinamidase-related amidase [Kineosphaera limosa]GAB96551.1 putative hydrolase [Kineosphaera limosa NBRC 100340]